MTLDALDAKIVTRLRADGRASFAEIGAGVGLSAPAVKRRVDRLLERGAITGFTAQVDPRALGWTTEAYVELSCQPRTTPQIIAEGVAQFPEVVDACTVSGDADAVLRVLARDMGHFESVLERIGAEPYVARTKSVLVLSRLVTREQIAPDHATIDT